MITVLEFIIIISIFTIFFLFYFLIGYFMLFWINKDFRNRKLSLRILLESFGIGMIGFISYSYFIEISIGFNFLTIIIPLSIFIIGSFLFWLKKDEVFREKFRIIQIKSNLRTLQKRIKWKFILGILVIFTLQTIIQFSIESFSHLPAKDPYLWFNGVMNLRLYGSTSIEITKGNSTGFLYFSAGFLLLINDYTIFYYFFKFLPIFLMYINILIIYDVSNKLFNRFEYIFFTLMVFMGFNFLFYRFLLSVPSILATTLGFIFLLTFKKEENNFLYLKRGILIGGILLCHILYGLFYLIIYLVFEIWILIRGKILSRSRAFEKYSFRISFKLFLKKISIVLICFMAFFSIIIINLLSKGLTLDEIIVSYLFYFGLGPSFPTSIISGGNIYSVSIYLSIFSQDLGLLTNIINFLSYINYSFLGTILSYPTIIIFFGLILNLNKEKDMSIDSKPIVNYALFTFIFIFIIFCIIGFNMIFFSLISQSTILNIYEYEFRLLELFSGIWAIIFSLVLKRLIEYINKKKTNKMKRDTKSKVKLEAKELGRAGIILLIGFSTLFYVNTLISSYTYLYINYYEDEDFGDITLYAGEYFYVTYGSETTPINLMLFSNEFNSQYGVNSPQTMFFLIDFYSYLNINNTILYNDTTDTQLNQIIQINSADYLITPKYELTISALDLIANNYTIIYENSRYLFFKV